MSEAIVPTINMGLLFLLLAGAIYLTAKSRHWTVPIQDARLQRLEDDHRVLRGNLSRIERDTHEMRREHLEVQDAILKELRAIHANGTKEGILSGAIAELHDRLEDMEQAIAAMPCGQVECIDPKAPNDAK